MSICRSSKAKPVGFSRLLFHSFTEVSTIRIAYYRITLLQSVLYTFQIGALVQLLRPDYRMGLLLR